MDRMRGLSVSHHPFRTGDFFVGIEANGFSHDGGGEKDRADLISRVHVLKTSELREGRFAKDADPTALADGAANE